MSRPMLWLVSEDAALAHTLAVHLDSVGELWTGGPQLYDFRDAPAPDLVVAMAVDAPGAEMVGLERLLAFLAKLPAPRRAPAPVLYVEPAGRRPSARLVRSLVDDRPCASVTPPLDPAAVAEAALDLLEDPKHLPSLRERARRAWVADRVELLYAGLDLPALRHAIDPRNASRPVLLCGEPGSQRGLLARYIHNLAEPPREELVVVDPRSLHAVEAQLLERSAGRRVSLLLESLDDAERGLQVELARVLSDSGALGIEPIRWVASAQDPAQLVTQLRQLPWLRVDLPPLRRRPDLDSLAHGLLGVLGAGREAALEPDALDALRHYLWPGNLRELESVLDASLAATSSDAIGRADLRFAPAPSQARPAHDAPASEEAPPPGEEPAPELEDLEYSEPPDPEPLAEPATSPAVELPELLAPLGRQIREPLLALRACATLLEQRPDDADVRRELAALAAGDLQRAEQLLERLETFSRLGPPKREPVDLAALVAGELERRQETMRGRELVVLRELELDVPPARADSEQLRFAVGALLDCALRLTPEGGDLYVGSLHRPAEGDVPEGHRLLIRFHSPEDVLDSPDSEPPLEVVLARALIERMDGAFAIDASGSQDNVVLIELPA
jgi:signal transduction histidine kinase